jgi:hypothetical protein
MVVIADRLSATEEAALRAAIDCLHAGRRRRGNKPQKRERRRRPEEFSSFNPNSLWSVPEGYYGRCPVPTCREAIPMHRAEEDIVRCSRGHVHSQEAEAERYWEGKRNLRCWDDDEFHGFKWPKNEAPWLIRPLVVPPEILQKLKAIERAAMPKRSRPRAKKKKQDIPF